jgi:polysaccharide pyruvyl transferase WcaK-like protein
MHITLLNPSIASENTGDYIIVDSVLQELLAIFKDQRIVHVPTQDIIGSASKKIIKTSSQKFIGGTNLLSSHMLKFKQWKIGLTDLPDIKDITLMGVGWWQYQNNPDMYTKFILKNVLSKDTLHSVRDNYTKIKLLSIGIKNVINTSCPTMWQLTPEHCEEIPCQKGENVVFTLTDYKPSLENDQKLIKILERNYSKIFFWPQGSRDLIYIKTIINSESNIKIIPPTLAAFNELLKKNSSVDFIGTRLHGGIRSLQYGRRSLILSVDNRAKEISKDTNLPVIDRNDHEGIQQWINKKEHTQLNINFNAIGEWRNQWK